MFNEFSPARRATCTSREVFDAALLAYCQRFYLDESVIRSMLDDDAAMLAYVRSRADYMPPRLLRPKTAAPPAKKAAKAPERPRTYDGIRSALRASWARHGLAPCPAPRPTAGPETAAAVPVMPSQAEHPAKTAAADAWSRVLAGINGR